MALGSRRPEVRSEVRSEVSSDLTSPFPLCGMTGAVVTQSALPNLSEPQCSQVGDGDDRGLLQ